MPLTTCILVHTPVGGPGPARWSGVAEQVLRRLAPAQVTPVHDAADAEAATLQAALAGQRRLIAVGGTAISHGLLNGVMRLAEGHRRELQVGFLSLGRRESWQRTLDQPPGLEAQLDLLAAGNTLPYDVGRADLHDAHGRPVTRYFLNGVSWGSAPPVDAAGAGRPPPWLRALAAALRALRQAPPEAGVVELKVNECPVYRGPLGWGMAMGGRFYPGLGQLARNADPTDGLLDLFWTPWGQPGATLGCLAGGLPYGHLLPAPRWQKAWKIGLKGLPDASGRMPALQVEGDGILLGTLPATLSVVERALPVIVRPVAVRLALPRRALARELETQGLVGSYKSAVGH